MSEMVERVAKAMATDQMRKVLHVAGLEFEGAQDGFLEKYAAIAIEAMRLPENTSEPLTYESMLRKQNYRELAKTFNSVIDTALKETEQ